MLFGGGIYHTLALLWILLFEIDIMLCLDIVCVVEEEDNFLKMKALIGKITKF